jgi:hypothetical protein
MQRRSLFVKMHLLRNRPLTDILELLEPLTANMSPIPGTDKDAHIAGADDQNSPKAFYRIPAGILINPAFKGFRKNTGQRFDLGFLLLARAASNNKAYLGFRQKSYALNAE